MKQVRWRLYGKQAAAIWATLILGVALLLVIDWGLQWAKCRADVPDCMLLADSSGLPLALAAACLMTAVVGRMLGLAFMWTSIGQPVLLCLVVLAYGVKRGFLGMPWEALESVTMSALGRHAAYPVALCVGVSLAASVLGTVSGTRPRAHKWAAGLGVVVSGLVLVSLFVVLTYFQLMAEVDMSDKWMRRVRDAARHRVLNPERPRRQPQPGEPGDPGRFVLRHPKSSRARD